MTKKRLPKQIRIGQVRAVILRNMKTEEVIELPQEVVTEGCVDLVDLDARVHEAIERQPNMNVFLRLVMRANKFYEERIPYTTPLVA